MKKRLWPYPLCLEDKYTVVHFRFCGGRLLHFHLICYLFEVTKRR